MFTPNSSLLTPHSSLLVDVHLAATGDILGVVIHRALEVDITAAGDIDIHIIGGDVVAIHITRAGNVDVELVAGHFHNNDVSAASDIGFGRGLDIQFAEFDITRAGDVEDGVFAGQLSHHDLARAGKIGCKGTCLDRIAGGKHA